MKFTPKSQSEIAEEGLFPEGTYGFLIDEAEEGKSKSSGNDMITLKIKVYDHEGKYRFVTDYLLESIAYKLRHACEAIGILEKYEKGVLSADDFIGKTGYLKLKIDPAKGDFSAKNSVKDYVVVESGVVTTPILDEDVPF